MILIFFSYRSGKTEQTGIRSRGILEFLAEFSMMRNSASYGGLHHAELRIMGNSASCGTQHHAKFSIMRNSTYYFPQGIGSLCRKRVPILRIDAELRIGFPLLAEYSNKFSVPCGIPQYRNICGTPQDIEK